MHVGKSASAARLDGKRKDLSRMFLLSGKSVTPTRDHYESMGTHGNIMITMDGCLFPLASARFRLFPLVSACFRLFSLVFACFRSLPLVSACFRLFFVCFQLFSLVFARFRLFPLVFTCSRLFRLFSLVYTFAYDL